MYIYIYVCMYINIYVYVVPHSRMNKIITLYYVYINACKRILAH